jgi:hypothetical protein
MATPNPQAQKGGYGYRPPVVKTPQLQGVKDPQAGPGGYGYRPPSNQPPAWLKPKGKPSQPSGPEGFPDPNENIMDPRIASGMDPDWRPSILRDPGVFDEHIMDPRIAAGMDPTGVTAPKDKPAGFAEFMASLYGWGGQHPFARPPKKKDAPLPEVPTGSFLGAGGDAVRNSTGAYWLPQDLPQYPTGSFFGGGGQYVAGPMDMMGLPAPDTGGFGSQYRGWGRRGGGGGGYGDGGYVPPWYMNLFSLNWER